VFTRKKEVINKSINIPTGKQMDNRTLKFEFGAESFDKIYNLVKDIEGNIVFERENEVKETV
jgi:hypothetical protein